MPRKKVALGRDPVPGDDPPKKDGPGRRRNVRGRKGGLKDMPTMPLDILLEIFRHLEPRDLLNLARTTKPFRDFLMSRNSASMWKAARANVKDLPDCPPHLSEPAYANLAFFPYCHHCLKPNVQTILWEFNTRYCPGCAKTLTIAMKDMMYQRRPQYSWALTWTYTPDAIFCTVNTNQKHAIYHCPELDKIKPIWDRTRDDADQWNKFVAEQKQRVLAIRRYATSCRIWDRGRASTRSAELQDIRERRLTTIVAKLRDLGWGGELDRIAMQGYCPLSEHAQVRPSKALTDRGWAKIRDEVVAKMQEIKDFRLRTERRALLRTRLNMLKAAVTAARTTPTKRTVEDEYKPKFQNLAFMPVFREFVDAPNDVVVNQEAFAALMPRLPLLDEQWQKESREQLRAKLADHVDAQDGADVLNLAVAVFKCKGCPRILGHPQVLAHECVGSLLMESPGQHDDYLKLVVDVGYKYPWNADHIQVVTELERVRAIIEICGKDPKVATQKDMDDADLRVVYDSPYDGGRVMSWRRAVRFVLNGIGTYGQFVRSQWMKATEEQKAAVKDREESHKAALMIDSYSRCLEWRCGYCDFIRPRTWHVVLQTEELKNHLKDK
ncbi:uncharacterized protein B0H18DRAFT_423867 [Fomitopsis serialis]|uniref:uncharacterized protein n=1 Tax=Fomitopsis serialis TaxID=139415 RepID=UPI0020079789|nr:uncharacterized protein B0H18DRAFT_423867 [Neoantrodia serialis]KAH9935794.1 hypothetical protein B0H18DRAFT_423867 [Neoantrodia serialis]